MLNDQSIIKLKHMMHSYNHNSSIFTDSVIPIGSMAYLSPGMNLNTGINPKMMEKIHMKITVRTVHLQTSDFFFQ